MNARVELKDYHSERCFSCGRKLRTGWYVQTKDEQIPIVGPECFKVIKASGPSGFQPLSGGLRLWTLDHDKTLLLNP